jgi:probable HAF family extracellular repeat protein
VGESSYPAPYFSRAFLYPGGGAQLVDLGTLGGLSSQAFGVNSSGIGAQTDVVGVSATTSGVAQAFLWAQGPPLINLGAPGLISVATGITNRLAGGEVWIVGTTYVAAPSNPQHAFIKRCVPPACDPTIDFIDALGISQTHSEANAINDSRVVTGGWTSSQTGGVLNAFRYNHSTSTFTNLGTPGKYSTGSGINASGQVVGVSDEGTGAFLDLRAALWTGTARTLLGVLPGGSGSYANGINTAGAVVGGTSGTFPAAFLWTAADGMQDLNTLVIPGSGYTVFNATAINDAGQIAAVGVNALDQEIALLLSICGNDVVDPGEQCDEGTNNGTPVGCCDANCRPKSDGSSCDVDVCTADACDAELGCTVNRGSDATGTWRVDLHLDLPADFTCSAQITQNGGTMSFVGVCEFGTITLTGTIDGAGNFTLSSAGPLCTTILAQGTVQPDQATITNGTFTCAAIGPGTFTACRDLNRDGTCDAQDTLCPSGLCDSDGDGLCDQTDPCPAVSPNTCVASRTLIGTVGGGTCECYNTGCTATAGVVTGVCASAGCCTLTTQDSSVSVIVPPTAVSGPTSISVTAQTGGSFGLQGNNLIFNTVDLSSSNPGTFASDVALRFRWNNTAGTCRVAELDPTKVTREGKLQVFRNGCPLTQPCGGVPPLDCPATDLGACCAGTCGTLNVPASCTSTPNPCTSASCDPAGNVYTVRVNDFSEYSLASPCDPAGPTFLRINHLDTPPGDDGLKVRGTLTLASTAGLDPLADGAGLLLDDSSGSVLNAGIPGGAFSPGTGSGWRVSPSGSKWVYRNTVGTGPGGIDKVVIRDASDRTPGLVKFLFRGRRGSYAAAPDVTAKVVLGTGDCLVAAFPGPAPAPTCVLVPPGRVLRCE